MNALERLTSTYGPPCAAIRQDLAIAQAQLRDYQLRLGAPFKHDAYLAELTACATGSRPACQTLHPSQKRMRFR